jgi:hypothetical protein
MVPKVKGVKNSKKKPLNTTMVDFWTPIKFFLFLFFY